MGLNEARERFREMLPDALRAAHVAAMEDDERAKLLDIKAGVLQAFEEAAPRPAPPVRIQRVDEYLAPGKYATTYEVVDTRLAGKRRIVASVASREEAEARRQKAYLIPVDGGFVRPVGGAAYTFAAVDSDEYFHDTDYETLASQTAYGVLTGCALTYDAVNMTVDLAAGAITHSFSYVTVAAAVDAYTLVADGSNERWAALCISSAGAAALVSGDPAASASSEPTKPEIGDRVLVGMAKIQAAQTVADNCEYKLDKRIFVAQGFRRKTAETQVVNNSATLVNDNTLAFAIGASETWIVDLYARVISSAAADFKSAWDVPASATIIGIGHHHDSVGGAVTIGNEFTADATAAEFNSASAGPFIHQEHVVIVNSTTAGTVQFQWAQTTATVVDTYVRTNSYITFRRVA